jgi:hypothetical protein
MVCVVHALTRFIHAANEKVGQGLTETEVVHAFMLTNAACFDLLMRQEHEWQNRIQILEDEWEVCRSAGDDNLMAIPLLCS